jgi:hypothetical protein
MSGKQFKNWMKSEGLKVRDVSFFTGYSSNTVYAYLRDETVAESTHQGMASFKENFERGAYQLPKRKAALAG